MIYERPIPAVDAEMPCDQCGRKDGARLYKLWFLCPDCLNRLIKNENGERKNVYKK